MSFKIREEIVGKRFLSVSGYSKLKLSKISEWCWRAGVIRASTHKDNTHKDLQLLVEYDDREWERREWVQPHKGGTFQVFLVERTLIWCSRAESPRSPSSSLGPALTFTTLVGELPSGQEAVEFIRDRHLAFRDPTTFKTVQDVDRRCREDQAVRDWIRCQDGQGILLTTPSILVGYRVQVYRVEGTTQWYTAVIVGYNPATGELTVTDDTVLEDHNEDPCLVQMRLIGDGVIESIMKGEKVGITPRRSRSSLVLSHRPIERPKREGKRKKAGPKKGGGSAKPPPRPPDRGKAVVTTEVPEPSPDEPEKEPSPAPEPEEPEPENTEETSGRTLRSLRSRSLEKVEVKARPAPKVKKKEKKEKKLEKEEEEEEPEEEEEEEEKKKECSDGEEGVKETEEEGGSPRLDDDDGPIPLSSPFRMEDSSGGSVLRDDRSDSGVSSLRSAGSGDERSGSRSSALSPTPPPSVRKIAEVGPRISSN